jgi:hypothetical protein
MKNNEIWIVSVPECDSDPMVVCTSEELAKEAARLGDEIMQEPGLTHIAKIPLASTIDQIRTLFHVEGSDAD